MDSSDVIVPQPPSSTPTSTTSAASRSNIGDIEGESMTLGQSDEPMPKKIKSETVIKRGFNDGDCLEERLERILCCSVCLGLPMTFIYQCKNGHLVCLPCFNHLLADSRLRDETATCPNCRCLINNEECIRNLAVEKAIQELPVKCTYCATAIPRANIEVHERSLCCERLITCRYERIGCLWRGAYHEKDVHESICSHLKKNGREILPIIEMMDKREREERLVYDSIFDLLSFEKILHQDIKWQPYRTDEYLPRLYYETNRFTLFDLQWVIKARVNDDQKDPTQSSERRITYQLCLKTRITDPLDFHFVILKGPYGDMKVTPRIYRSEFTSSKMESNYNPLPLMDSTECNRLLSGKVIHFRFFMFQVQK
ncbi:zinc finger TRAF-type-containing protein 1-B [Brevipalpus obovatus]|uniref:zinc finger TRAF-type-containing protein 1-B n=1 Tax=Brevipalpus obovatus TaxID=246614 RepID=UPI003D9DE8A4